MMLSLILAATLATSGAQTIRFDQLTIANGLSSNSVYTIYQDRYGVLWLGTLDGLNRYDGYEMTVFKHDRQQKESISNNRVTHIYEDWNRQLWLYDEFSSTIMKYNPYKNSFSTYNLGIIVYADLRTLDSLYEGQDGKLYVRGIDGYLLSYDTEKDAFHFVKKGSATPWHERSQWRKLCLSFARYLSTTKRRFTINSIEIRKIIQDKSGRYWIATKYDGLFSVDESNGDFKFTSHLDATEKYSRIDSKEIYDIYEDRSGVVWIGTKNRGLFRYSRHRYKFDHLSEVSANGTTLAIGTVRAITQTKDKALWVGANEQGLLRIDPTLKNGKLYKSEAGKSASLGHPFVRSLWVDRNNTLWVGHYNGFSKYKPSSDDFLTYMPRTTANDEIRVYDFKEGPGDTFWMAAWDVIINFDPKKGTFRNISRSQSGGTQFSGQNIRDLELDNDKNLWMAAGEKGISVFNNARHVFTNVYADPSEDEGIPSNNIFEVYRDKDHGMWLATADGLCEFDPVNMKSKTYTTNEGLPSNLVYGIMEDGHGNLWYSTTKGLGKFDRKNKRFRNYDISDGLQSNEFTENALYQSEDGTMYFGGINGLNIFHPDNVPDNTIPPSVLITSIKAFEKPLSETQSFNEVQVKQKIEHQQDIVLPPEQRTLSLEFVALHFVNPEKNQFAYKLKGFDETWTYRDANARFANYTNLEPGSYYFLLKAANSDGVWSKPIELKITIEKPFYATWWFTSFIVAAGMLGGVFAYRWRIALVRKQQSMKSSRLESELNFLKSQVNPHFLFNTLNNIYALCQTNSVNAAPMVGKISEMMRYMIYDCNADYVSLQKEIDYLQNYIDLNQLKSRRTLNASISIDGSTEGRKIAPLMLINFLENSFKHGDLNRNGDGFIRAELVIKGSELFLKIRNSFRDRPADNDGRKGIGLENVKQRLSLLYPGRHNLVIRENNCIFEIELNLQLD